VLRGNPYEIESKQNINAYNNKITSKQCLSEATSEEIVVEVTEAEGVDRRTEGVAVAINPQPATRRRRTSST
jgi:hypothetical protein